MLSVNAVLEDAEGKPDTNRNVKDWIDDLKDAIYDAEDILEETLINATNASWGKLLNYFFSPAIVSKVKKVHDRLALLAEQRDLMDPLQGVGCKSFIRLAPTASLVQESFFLGRDDDKEAIISHLRSIGHCRPDDSKICVIAIVGTGGIGKTTLGKVVYDDIRVKEHFDIQAWVCVSKILNMFKVAQTLLEAISSSTCTTSKDLNMIQLKLMDELSGKRLLLVLDDVWNMNFTVWNILSNPLKCGAQGSKVIVITRDEDVASIMCADTTHHLNPLPDEECWLLFVKYAIQEGSFNNSPLDQELEEIGRQIVRKCKGLPLAIKTIGALLQCNQVVAAWKQVLTSDLWDFPNEPIVPALILSYKCLPLELKRCFAYCSIFPKAYIFEKDELVLLWMAEGFLQESMNKTMEEVGDDYFFDLVSRSFFQQASGSKSSCFVMHDLINDLARFVSAKFNVALESNDSQEIVSKTRYFSYIIDVFEKFEPLCKEARRLRTFLPLELSPRNCDFLSTKRLPRNLFLKLTRLRMLSLSHYRDYMIELPESIENIIHLRYLDLSFTKVGKLPDSICELINLQTLKLSGCRDLSLLPREMRKLVNLRHLDITATRIKHMPIELSRLECLRTLTTFVVGKDGGSCIGELGKLENLRGKLSILELQNITSGKDAWDASLKSMENIEKLELKWNAVDNISENQRIILDNLQPHTNLKSLTINYYGGNSFPDWLGHQSYRNITSLHLEKCTYCCSLPPLGQLPHLQDLSIIGFSGVTTVGLEFYGCGSSSIEPFGALEVLKFQQMMKWEEWLPFSAGSEGGEAFPRLGELYIDDCPKLKRGLPVGFSSLDKLAIKKCPELVVPLPMTRNTCELELIHCNEALLKELRSGVQKLAVEGFDVLDSLPEGMMNSNDNLQELRITDCFSLMTLPDGSLLSKLKTLEINMCQKLEIPMHSQYSSLERLKLFKTCESLTSFQLDQFPKLSTITTSWCKNLESFAVSERYEYDSMVSWIEIHNCPNFKSFPKGGLRAPNLTYFCLNNCENLSSLPDNMHLLLPSLMCLHVLNCPEIEYFPKDGLPSGLNSIIIYCCDKLFANRKGWVLQKLPSLIKLEIGGNSEDLESFPEAGLLPTTLTHLSINGFPNLKSLDREGLQHLTSLQRLRIEYCSTLECIRGVALLAFLSHLQINHCPKFKDMPKEGLHSSLSLIQINGCPLLAKQLDGKKGREWHKIAKAHRIMIDGEFIE
ncbi:putative disease resistance protein At3g14460 [Juglans microcarpa x Juglans regia]|uniref:putative disease resistance protein At3g14460 n=1 Tax=Juglans microcarpa x Juglans regia TaxID=2249226 RepID=UPI001B7DFBD2|nr:putative disease resistance protein At3g14460 [Juglans microcarpa x Juglans regia]